MKHVARLQGTLDRERDERNFYQLERDRVDTFWEVTRGELGETRAEVRVKDRSGRLIVRVYYNLCCLTCFNPKL